MIGGISAGDKILITGANGFLGYYLVEKLLQACEAIIIATGKGECRLPFTDHERFIYERMDFTDPFQVHDVFEKYQPQFVVHAGAMTKPDECELEQWQAYITNTEGTLTLLLNAEEYKSFFLFVSTDFIFDGVAGMYKEEDAANPVNFYGKTKQEAEEAVKEYEYDWAIARTVLVYGKPMIGRGNILTVVKEKLEKGEPYRVVDDQVRTPTFVGDLVNGLVAILERKATGIFHLSGNEVLTPYEMACRTADFLQLDGSVLERVTADTFSQPARRPPKTGFNITKAARLLNFQPISFEEGLKKTFID